MEELQQHINIMMQNWSEVMNGFTTVAAIVIPIGIAYWTFVYGKKHYDMRMFLSLSFFAILSAAACTVATYYYVVMREDPIGYGIGLAGALLMLLGTVRNMMMSNFLFGLWYSIVQYVISVLGVLAVVYLFARRRFRIFP